MPAKRHHKWHTCSICERKFYGWGNNPEPVKLFADGVCCDACNDMVVIPTRLKAMLTARSPNKKAPPIGNDVDTEAGTDDAVTT